MNIFALSRDPIECARMHFDRHVVKMCIEYSQLLATAHRVIDGTVAKFNHPKKGIIDYKYALAEETESPVMPLASHQNHPSNIWVRECTANYEWLYQLYLALGDEYTYRYGKVHASLRHADRLQYFPENITYSQKMTPFALAMPDEFKESNPISSYRKYIMYGKRPDLHVWTKRKRPSWFLK